MLDNVILPETIRKIGSNAFSNCSSLKNIVFSDNLRIIGSEAFSGCIELKELILPKDVISIGNNIALNTHIEYAILHKRFRETVDLIFPNYVKVENLEKDMIKVTLN